MTSLRTFLKRYDFPIHLFVAWSFLAHTLSLRVNTARAKLWLRATGCAYGAGFKACGRPLLRIARRGALRFGDGVMLQSRLASNLAGGTGPTILHCLDGGRIVFGNGSGCSFATISSRSSVTIGDRVLIGANARIFDHDFHALDATARRTRAGDLAGAATAPIVIGDEVFIGAGALILKGVTIGARAVVGAGAVVARSIPADELWAGNPARFVRKMAATATQPVDGATASGGRRVG